MTAKPPVDSSETGTTRPYTDGTRPDPPQVAERLQQARDLIRDAEYDRATDVLVECLAADPGNEYRHLTWALEAAPNDVELHRCAGKALARMRKFDEALACWQRVEDLRPEDAEAATMVSTLTIERSRARAGVEREDEPPVAAAGQSVPRTKTAPQQVPTVQSFERRVRLDVPLPALDVKLTPIQQLEHAVRENPSNTDLYGQLTQLYLDEGREFHAEQLLSKGRKATDDDPGIRRLWEDVTMLRLDKKFTLAQKRVEVEATSEAQAALEEVRRERDHVGAEILEDRCRREPDNAAARLQLGQRLKRGGKAREAFPILEQALNDAGQKCFAAYEMGECLRAFQEYPQALKYYRLAVDAATQPEHAVCKKQALYQAGTLAAQIKLYKPAQRYLTELLQLDANYADAAALLKQVNASAGD